MTSTGPNLSLVSTGLPGERGTPGLPGPKGDDGRPGATGVMGMRGIKGNNESQSTLAHGWLPGTHMGIAADGLALNSGYATGQLSDPEQVT